jgi:hypothetical protein
MLNRNKIKILGLLLFLVIACSCKKEKVPVPDEPEVQEWEKFVGSYKVFDTLGIYLFDASISHFSGINQYGVMVDSIRIKNFADTLDLKFQFIEDTYNKAIMNIGFSQPAYDKLNNPWNITTNMQDTLTLILENNLVNDTMILYFRMTNITYYDNISTFYYWCDCKHVYVKQK